MPNSLNQSRPLPVDVSQSGNPVRYFIPCNLEPSKGIRMPIVVLIASTLIFWLIYWFVRMGGIDHFREQSQRRRDAARRTQARESERTAPLCAIDDPREAAIVLMLLIPRGSDPTASQIAAIEDKMR